MSAIEWTDTTWNPVRGCSRVSPGCDHCYAMRQARRFDRPGGAYEGLTRVGSRGVDWSGRVRLVPEMLDQPLRWRRPRRVFVNSMSDLFHEALSLEDIGRVFGIMADAPRHTFQILTKRARRMREALIAIEDAVDPERHGYSWPLPNVWLGVSAEDQQRADERIPELLQAPAVVRFVSAEPLLGPIDFEGTPGPDGVGIDYPEGLDWVIVGGESGPGARPCDVAWIRSIVRQCREAGVACFVKQLGARPVSDADDDRRHCGDMTLPSPFRMLLQSRKGGDPGEWPEDLRVREFPA